MFVPNNSQLPLKAGGGGGMEANTNWTPSVEHVINPIEWSKISG